MPHICICISIGKLAKNQLQNRSVKAKSFWHISFRRQSDLKQVDCFLKFNKLKIVDILEFFEIFEIFLKIWFFFENMIFLKLWFFLKFWNFLKIWKFRNFLIITEILSFYKKSKVSSVQWTNLYIIRRFVWGLQTFKGQIWKKKLTFPRRRLTSFWPSSGKNVNNF